MEHNGQVTIAPMELQTVYGVFEAGDRGFNNWYYKATGKSKDYQFEAYPTGSFGESNGKRRLYYSQCMEL